MPKPRVLRRISIPASLALLLAVLSAAQQAQSANPDRDLREFRLDRLELALKAMPPGAERNYFDGMIANREGDIDRSISQLKAALPGLRAANPERAAFALEALADDYEKTFRYADAAGAYKDLLSHFASQLTPENHQEAMDNAGVDNILRNSPPQTIDWHGPAKLKTERNPINSLNAQLTVNGVTGPWLLDTGANVSVVSKSFAKKIGLELLPGSAQTQAGLTGIENPMRIGVLHTLRFGGATLHNVVLLVLDDANLVSPPARRNTRFRPSSAILPFRPWERLPSCTEATLRRVRVRQPAKAAPACT